jgi:citrate lyase subunit beta/citryl-CoA lyase
VLVVASRAAGLPGPVNSVYAKLDDPDGLLEHAKAARAIGFGAQSALTPPQLPAIHQVFGIAAERIVWAREVLGAFRAAGGAACRTASGEFVDLPIAQEAQRILAAG